MERMQTTSHEFAHDDLTLDELEGLEVIELPERELMCGYGGTSLFAGAALATGAGVNLGCTGVNASLAVNARVGAGTGSCG